MESTVVDPSHVSRAAERSVPGAQWPTVRGLAQGGEDVLAEAVEAAVVVDDHVSVQDLDALLGGVTPVPSEAPSSARDVPDFPAEVADSLGLILEANVTDDEPRELRASSP